MKKRMAGKLVYVLVFLTLTGTAWADQHGGTYLETAATAREILWETITSGNTNAATVAVMDRGKIVYSQGFGVADRRTDRPIEAETRFNIGSTSKMFAAVAILLLQDEAKLSLEDPVTKHLPEFTMRDPRYRDITIRMLFNHSSGLPGTTFEVEYERGLDAHELLLKTLREDNLKHAPGAMSIYCNDGFTLAEMIVEKLSGKTFLEFLKEQVFEPLEIQHTGPSIGQSPGNVASYYALPEGKKYPLEILTVYAAGGLSSTAEDLCRFADSLTPEGKHILSPSSLEEILSEQPTPFSAFFRGEELLGFKKPEKGGVLLFSEKEGNVHTLYDSLLDNDEVYAPEGTFLFLAGAPGSVFKISAR